MLNMELSYAEIRLLNIMMSGRAADMLERGNTRDAAVYALLHDKLQDMLEMAEPARRVQEAF